MDQQPMQNTPPEQPAMPPQKTCCKPWHIAAIVAAILIIGGVVYGVYDFLYGKKFCCSPSEADLTASYSASPNETAEWKTYKNEKYNYEISYPKNVYTTQNLFNPEQPINPDGFRLLDIKTAQESIQCHCGEADDIVISAYSNPQKLSADDYFKQNWQQWLGEPSDISDFSTNEPVIFNSMPARKFGTDRDTYFLIVKDTFVFRITAGDQDILSTFKFTK